MGLFSLFKGIQIIMGYFMPKATLRECKVIERLMVSPRYKEKEANFGGGSERKKSKKKKTMSLREQPVDR